MTERHMGYVVVLDGDVRDDEAHHVINAIRMVRGVSEVVAVTADYEADVIASRRRDRQWTEALLKLINDVQGMPTGGRKKEGRGQ